MHAASLSEGWGERQMIFRNFLALPKDMLIDFRERGKEGKSEGEKDGCERETLIGCPLYVPQPGTKHAT